jgi:hypothetical protein
MVYPSVRARIGEVTRRFLTGNGTNIVTSARVHKNRHREHQIKTQHSGLPETYGSLARFSPSSHKSVSFLNVLLSYGICLHPIRSPERNTYPSRVGTGALEPVCVVVRRGPSKRNSPGQPQRTVAMIHHVLSIRVLHDKYNLRGSGVGIEGIIITYSSTPPDVGATETSWRQLTRYHGRLQEGTQSHRLPRL